MVPRPQFVPHFGLFLDLKALRAFKHQRPSDQILTYFNASAVSRSASKPKIFLSLQVCGQYIIFIGVATFFQAGLKLDLDEKSTENGLEGQKC